MYFAAFLGLRGKCKFLNPGGFFTGKPRPRKSDPPFYGTAQEFEQIYYSIYFVTLSIHFIKLL